MSNDPMSHATPAASVTTKGPGRLSRWILAARAWHARIMGHPVKSVLFAIGAFLALWGANEALSDAKAAMMGEDRYLESLREEQAKSFADIKQGLSELKRGLPAEDKDALKRVSSSIAHLESLQGGLTRQLKLANSESRRLSQALEAAGRPPGGYDFILSEHGGFTLSKSSVLGLETVNERGVRASVSTMGGEDVRSKFISSGMALPFRDDAGRECKVALVSVEGGAAAFKVICGGTPTRA